MSRHLSVSNVLFVIVAANAALAALVYFGGAQIGPALSGLLPGKFGPGLGANMTGNHLFAALVLYLDALLFHGLGFGGLLHASRHSLLIGPDRIQRLLGGLAHFSQEDIAATNLVVAQEQKREIGFLRAGRRLVWIGAVLLLVAFPAVCFTYAHANAGGVPLLTAAGGAIANDTLAAKDAGLFTADQLASAALLDIPAIYKWHATPIGPNDAHHGLKIFIVLFHILVKLVIIATIFALWRSAHLRAYVLRLAGPAEKIPPSDDVPMETTLQDIRPAEESPGDPVPEEHVEEDAQAHEDAPAPVVPSAEHTHDPAPAPH